MTRPHDRQLVNALLRQDLSAFTQRCFQTVAPGRSYVPNWHLNAIAHHLELCRRGEIRRLMIMLPPRSLKSICASVAFPAFALGHDPTQRVVCVSYANELAAKHARDCRSVMEAAWYRKLFPRTRFDPRKNTEFEFETTGRGFRLATSVGGTLTGRGGNLIVIDDPLKPADALSDSKRRAANEWFDNTLYSRLDSKTDDVIVLVMQRLHVDDLVGHILAKGEGWTQLCLPAIAEAPEEIAIGPGRFHRRAPGDLLQPDYEPQAALDEAKRNLGTQAFLAQYQQAPVPPGGALVRRDWLAFYSRPPERKRGDKLIQSWDTASKGGATNDFSVCTTWLMRGKDYYLLDVLRQRLEYTKLRRAVLTQAERHAPQAVLIEDTGAGTSLIQELKHERQVGPIAIRPEGDKVMRLEAQTPVIEAGHVFLPESAPWLEDFIAEILAFPVGRHDDQVDSVSQFLNWAAAQQRRLAFIPGPIVILKQPGRWYSSPD